MKPPLIYLLILALLPAWPLLAAERGVTADPPAPLPMSTVSRFDFQDQSLGPVAFGGAAAGQPHSRTSTAVSANVVNFDGAQALEVSALGSATPATEAVHFQWPGNANLTDELVRIRLSLTPKALDNFLVRVSRAGGVADTVLTLAFRPSGQIRVEGPPTTVTVGSYTADSTVEIVVDINRADGSWSLALDGSRVLNHRPSAVATTGAGIGRLSLGWMAPLMGGAPTEGQPFVVDRIEVSTPANLAPLLLADFAGMTPGAAIGTGGAALGEPVAIAANLSTEVLDLGSGERALRIRRASAGLNALVDWRLLDEVTVPAGAVVSDQIITLRDATELFYLLTDAAGVEILRLTTNSAGRIFVRFTDEMFSGTDIAGYTVGTPFRVRASCDLDGRHCSVAVGTRWQVTARPLPADLPSPLTVATVRTGYTLLTSVDHRFDLDRVSLHSNGPTGTPTRIEYLQQPVAVPLLEPMDPPIRLRVTDPAGAPVADGTSVMIEVAEGGPFTALLSDDRAFTVGGEVSFAAQFGDRGTAYRLLAYVEDPPYGAIEALSLPFAVGPGLPAAMVWTQQPTDVLVGLSVEPEVAVQLRDVAGDAVDAGRLLRLRVVSGPAGAALGGNEVATGSDGVARFPDLEFHQPGSYVLGAEVDHGGFTETPSVAFQVFANVPASALFQVQPSTGPAAEPVSPTVAVRVDNPLGGPVPDGTMVELVRASGPSSPGLSGNTAVTLAGVASFPDLRLSQPGSYSLRAEVDGLDAGLAPVSVSFQRLPGPPASLAVTAYPDSPAALLAVSPLDVQVSDAEGFPVGLVLVHAEIASGPPGAVLLGPANATSFPSGSHPGRAPFAGRLRFSLPGTYTLRFFVDGGPEVLSDPIQVRPGGAASGSFVVQPPESVYATLPLVPTVEVELRDATGALVMDGIEVGMMVFPDGEPESAQLSASALTESGRVRFPGLSIAEPGRWRLRIAVEGIEDEDAPTSVAFDVLANPTVTPLAGAGGSISPSTPQTVIHGQTAAFTVTPNAGFAVLAVGGSCGGALVGSTYTTNTVTADCTVLASFGESTTATLSTPANPARWTVPVAFTVDVLGSATAPSDGQVLVIADTGESCVDTGAPTIIGMVARYACSITFATLGPRTLTAAFSASASHHGSDSAGMALAIKRFADVSVTVDDGQTLVEPGTPVAYLIQLRNAGPDSAPNTELLVAAVPGLLSPTWLCSANGGASCPASSGSGEIAATVTLPSGSGLDFIQEGVLAASLPATVLLQAQATVSETSPDEVYDPNSSNNIDTDINLVDALFRDGFEN